MTKVYKFSFLLIILTYPVLLFSQDVLTSESLLNFRRISDPILIKNNLVYYSVSDVNISENKYSSSYYTTNLLNGNTDKFQLNENVNPEIIKPFSKSNKLLISTSEANNESVFYSYITDTKILKKAGKINWGKKDFFEESINDFIISADERNIAFVTSKSKKASDYVHKKFTKANFRNIEQLDYRHWASWNDTDIKYQIYIAEIINDSITNLKLIQNESDFPFDDLSFSADKNFLLYSSKKIKGDAEVQSTNSDIYLLNLQSLETINISDGRMGYDRNPKFSPDGNFISYLSMPGAGYESDRAAFLIYDLKTKTTTEPFVSFEEGIEFYDWNKDSKKIFFISPSYGTEQVFEGILATKKVRQVTKDVANYTAFILNDKELIASKTSISYPKEIVRVDIEKGTENRLTKLNDEVVSKIKWGKVEKSLIKTTDGKDMLVWLIYPPDFDKSKKYPALLYCQGGPQSMVSQNFSYRWNLQLMAANGYVVIAPNRRGLPGFGRKWCDDIALNWGGQAIEDYLSAVDSVSKNSFIDKSRLGAVGASYGGYSVYYLAGKHNKRFKSFISHCGLFNLESWYTMTDEMFFSKHDIGVPYWENKTAYEKFSPHKFVQNWDTPIFIIHGEKDFRVPVSEGMQAFGAAKLKGLKTKMLLFPEEGHWVLKPQNSMIWHEEFYNWLNETLK